MLPVDRQQVSEDGIRLVTGTRIPVDPSMLLPEGLVGLIDTENKAVTIVRTGSSQSTVVIHKVGIRPSAGKVETPSLKGCLPSLLSLTNEPVIWVLKDKVLCILFPYLVVIVGEGTVRTGAMRSKPIQQAVVAGKVVRRVTVPQMILPHANVQGLRPVLERDSHDILVLYTSRWSFDA